MAGTPFELERIARNADFQARVKHDMQKGAVAVLAELATTPGNSERTAYARKVLVSDVDPYEHGLAALTNNTLTTAADVRETKDGGYGITDLDLEFAVNQMWNAMSGYSTG